MALPVLIQKLEDVAEPLREHYTKTDDGYVLGTDTGGYNTRLSEFRNNNIDLKQQHETAIADLAKFKGIDPDKAAAAQKKLDELENKGLADAGKFDELLQKKVSEIESRFSGQIEALTTGKETAEAQTLTYQTKLNDLAINDVISKGVSNVGKLHKGALGDVIARAKSVWTVNEAGVPIAKDGDTVLYGKDGKLPLTAEEWAGNLMQSSPYLFEGHTGGGAGGSGGSGGSGGPQKIITSQQAEGGDFIDGLASGKTVVG